MEPPWDREKFIQMTKMAAMHIYSENINNLLFYNQMAEDRETWYAGSGARVLPNYSNDDPGLTLTYLTARSNLVPYAFVKQWIFQKLL